MDGRKILEVFDFQIVVEFFFGQPEILVSVEYYYF
jgi:hypothetical protein